MAIAWCFQLSSVLENPMPWPENLAWPHHALERPWHDGICGASRDLHLLYPVILVLLNSKLVSVPLGAQSTLVARVMRCVVFFGSGHWDDDMMVSLGATGASAVMIRFWNVADLQANAVPFQF